MIVQVDVVKQYVVDEICDLCQKWINLWQCYGCVFNCCGDSCGDEEVDLLLGFECWYLGN